MTPSILPDATSTPVVEAAVVPVEAEAGGSMTFFEHLVELRKRIINSLIAIGVGALIGVYFSKYFIQIINRPILKALKDAGLDAKLIFTHPADGLNLVISVGVYLGIALASPIVLYQVWLFVAPALYKHERGAITGFLFSTVFLFLCGIAFGYFITLPYILHFMVNPSSFFKLQQEIVPMISVNEYFDMILLTLLGIGLMFELPILIFFLSLFGIVTPQFLIRNFRYAILIIAVGAAVAAPPDALSMLIFMAPMVVLYFISVAVSAIVVRKRKKRLAAEGAS